ncbi:DUF2520 domain-containing protein [Pontibacter sp. 172403-2]|uniref:Rossmann-like and DUF2520 domain-containing protein n=1 Tax=Pontibacter rufus TaxID=2791028 RepID=UPI0018AFE218|nr:Rossmann-like and DUF2520 domain-containing protein [Pontibacter sp. 172403-2]MBF9251763.1 DUF2520 domain-containing protein [Pontibacter sp. 172403-2]
MKIAFIGAGNVAWHLSQALAAAGHEITAVYSRSATSREALARLLPAAKPVASLAELAGMAADIILIAVPDAVIATVAQQLQVPPGTLVAHTSGSQPLAILEDINGARTGVFYPLQTFSKAKAVDFKAVPLLIEARDEQALQKLEQLAQSISDQVQRVSSEARRQLHLAAVFACNFTNHLLGISRELLQEANLPPGLLQPLIHETIAKAALHPPFEVQTGPAVRHDENVIAGHLHLLAQHPRYSELYRQLTDSIQATKNKV